MKTIRSQRRHVQKANDHRRGAALAEFAVVCPLFLMLVLGTIELGSALRTSTTMASALREGGRLGAMDWEEIVQAGDNPNSKVIRDVRNFMKASGLPGDAITIEIVSAEGADAGQTFNLADPDNDNRLFKVTATVPYTTISTFPIQYLNGATLSSHVVMRAARATLAGS